MVAFWLSRTLQSFGVYLWEGFSMPAGWGWVGLLQILLSSRWCLLCRDKATGKDIPNPVVRIPPPRVLGGAFVSPGSQLQVHHKHFPPSLPQVGSRNFPSLNNVFSSLGATWAASELHILPPGYHLCHLCRG